MKGRERNGGDPRGSVDTGSRLHQDDLRVAGPPGHPYHGALPASVGTAFGSAEPDGCPVGRERLLPGAPLATLGVIQRLGWRRPQAAALSVVRGAFSQRARRAHGNIADVARARDLEEGQSAPGPKARVAGPESWPRMTLANRPGGPGSWWAVLRIRGGQDDGWKSTEAGRRARR